MKPLRIARHGIFIVAPFVTLREGQEAGDHENGQQYDFLHKQTVL